MNENIKPEDETTEAHGIRISGLPAEETEGHEVSSGRAVPAEDTEGHGAYANRALSDDEDGTEGHGFRGNAQPGEEDAEGEAGKSKG